jgi:MFS family permease
LATEARAGSPGTDRLLYGMILGVLAFWLFAQTTLNIASTMAADLGIAPSVMNIAVSITALFSGIFIVVIGGLADRVGRLVDGIVGRIGIRRPLRRADGSQRRLALSSSGRRWFRSPRSLPLARTSS